jgi:site-specific recombinase XerC
VVRSTAKGRRELVLPIGTKSARDIDRYSRVRAGHPHAADPWLWLGTNGRLTASGVYQRIKDRGAAVGLPDLHPHQLRHAFPHDWAHPLEYYREILSGVRLYATVISAYVDGIAPDPGSWCVRW